VQQRRSDVGRFAALAIHDPAPPNTSTAADAMSMAPRIDQFTERS
jgi:hypothetical protein